MKVLYGATLFGGAALLFLVQPMIGKMTLPALGGSPTVWITCMLFFQAALLCGYLYAHLIATRLVGWLQVIVHLALLLVSAACLPIALPKDWTMPGDAHPVPWLLGELAFTTGLPFLAVSASSPLLQRWFSRTGGTTPRDPYFLYAASNAGSMIGLVGYPIMVEPNFTLGRQAVLWTGGYGLLAVLTGICGWTFWRTSRSQADQEIVADCPPNQVTAWRRVRWVALAFVPSSLMLGVTSLLSTDIPPVPLLWIAPLALYLLSMVLAFGRLPDWARKTVTLATPLAIAAEVYFVLSKPAFSLGVQIAAHLSTFFVIALGFHGELARLRPAVRRLTEFYIWLSVGGVLGGAFNALLAPAIFSSIAEVPITLISAALLMPPIFNKPSIRILSRLNTQIPAGFGLGVAALFFANAAGQQSDSTVLFQERSFFGVSRVVVGNKKNVHWYVHGRVEHGGQAFSDNPATQFAPFLYYDPYGPVGQIFLAQMEARQVAPVGIVGLGCGSLAYYGLPGQQFTFYEIDPLVQKIAENSSYFTFLKESQANCQVVLGDARLSLQKEPDGYFGLLIIDAFTGDVIPVHLLTAEAIDLYMRKLAPEGAIAFHLSSNFLELEPVIAAIAKEKHFYGLSRRDRGIDLTEPDIRRGRRPCHWILVSPSESGLKWVASDPRWKPLTGRLGSRMWTDDYSNILAAIR